jgi:DNA-binding NarL/FixJ family response regulator
VLSEHTIRRHVANILKKMDAPSRTAAATLATRESLV